MSIFQFLASDKPLKEIKTFHEGKSDEIEIMNNMYYSVEVAKEYSDKIYFSELYLDCKEPSIKALIDYLKIELENIDEIEIWSLWLGESIELDDHIWICNNKWIDDDIWLDYNKPPSIKSVSISELNIQDLKFLDNQYKPTCLIVTK